MKRVTASLFNFLDSQQRGTVNFEQLLIKLYPTLTKVHLKLIGNWIKQYIKTFAAENKDIILDTKDEKVGKRKRVLPRTALKRIKEVFDHLDEDQKGCKKCKESDKVIHQLIISSSFQRHHT